MGKSDDIKELYNTFKTAIINLNNNIEINPKKKRISFVLLDKIFCDICIQKNNLKIWINLKKGELEDSKRLSRDVSKVGHRGNGDYELTVSNTDNLEYIMSLIKQAIK
ncbi:MAG: DUF5655 domain-containing protein [Tannerellaceae bacterium]|nr:DUF5655 domain-containing protein [Tannerellaceae bacterium]